MLPCNILFQRSVDVLCHFTLLQVLTIFQHIFVSVCHYAHEIRTAWAILMSHDSRMSSSNVECHLTAVWAQLK